jgi:DNA-binding NarL/FixJ family response regulator
MEKRPAHTMSPARPALPAIIVAAAPGIHRDALVSFLRAQPDCTVAAVIGELPDLRRLAAAGDVRTVVLDAGLAGPAVVDLVRWLREISPAQRCVVLAGSARQCAACIEAGAHAALLKGCLDQRLLTAVRG